MRLTRKQTICDIPILKIRDYFDHIRPALISPEMISEQFDLNKEKTKELIDALLSEGYIEAAKKKGKYQLTIKGQALCVARYTNPLNKEKADKLFKEFMERVEEINSNEFYLYRAAFILHLEQYDTFRVSDLIEEGRERFSGEFCFLNSLLVHFHKFLMAFGLAGEFKRNVDV